MTRKNQHEIRIPKEGDILITPTNLIWVKECRIHYKKTQPDLWSSDHIQSLRVYFKEITKISPGRGIKYIKHVDFEIYDPEDITFKKIATAKTQQEWRKHKIAHQVI